MKASALLILLIAIKNTKHTFASIIRLPEFYLKIQKGNRSETFPDTLLLLRPISVQSYKSKFKNDLFCYCREGEHVNKLLRCIKNEISR